MSAGRTLALSLMVLFAVATPLRLVVTPHGDTPGWLALTPWQVQAREGGGGGGNGNGNGNDNGNSGGNGNSSGNGGGNSGSNSGNDSAHDGPAATTGIGPEAPEANVSGSGNVPSITVEHSNGAVERVFRGRYEMRDTRSRTIVNRPARPADISRLKSLSR